MSEAVYTQVEDAIARHLHVMVPGGGVFGPGYRYPVGIEHGNIVMRDSDCGLAKPVIVWTTDQWRTHVDESGRGLYKQVGFWSFEAADDPAANDIRLCHQSPGSAGRRLYEMRGEIERLTAALQYEQHRAGRQGTHGDGCADWGPAHYECAIRERDELRRQLAEADKSIAHPDRGGSDERMAEVNVAWAKAQEAAK